MKRERLTAGDGMKRAKDAPMIPATISEREMRLALCAEKSSSPRFRHHSEPSEPERKMRSILDSMGLEYVYQFPTRSGFVLDFAFLDRQKAIEVDGFYHQFRKPKDALRDYILRRAGWRILRISACDLETEGTLEKIKRFLG